MQSHIIHVTAIGNFHFTNWKRTSLRS